MTIEAAILENENEKMLAPDAVDDNADSTAIDQLVIGDKPRLAPQEDSMEERKVAWVKDPSVPIAADIAEHNITHANDRSWCPICVAAKGVSDSHVVQPDKSERAMSTVGADYCFMCRDPVMEEAACKEDDDTEEDVAAAAEIPNITILTVVDSMTGCMRLHYVPHKGTKRCPWIGVDVAKNIE